MILLVFGWQLIGSMFIFFGWFREGWRHRVPMTIYNAGLFLSIGMDLHSLGMALQIYGRLEQMLRDGQSFATEDPLYWIGAALVIIGKTFFVWVAALGKGRSYSIKFISAYWLCLAGWAAFALWWNLWRA